MEKVPWDVGRDEVLVGLIGDVREGKGETQKHAFGGIYRI